MAADKRDDLIDAQLAAARTEAARRQSFIDALLEAIDVGIVSCDADGVFVMSNRAERALFGLEDKISGKPIEYLTPRIDVFDSSGTRLTAERYPLARALRGEDVSSVDVVAGPSGGPYRELHIRARQMKSEGGAVIGAVAALADVTAERAATRELANEHRRLVEAQRLGQIGSFEYDFPTATWTFSDHLGSLWGVGPGAVDVGTLISHVVDAHRQAIREIWGLACREGGAHRAEVAIRRPDDGRERLLRIDIEVDLDVDGRPLHARGTHLDITDLTAAETEARRANAFLNALLAATPDLTIVSDVRTGKVIYGSPGQAVLGIGSADLARMGFDGFLAGVRPEDRPRVRDAVARAAAIDSGRVVTVQYRSRRSDGAQRWISHRITPFRRDDRGQVVEVVSVLRDVTEIVDAGQRLIHAATHDYLTGLPNRVKLIEKLDSALARSEAEGEEIAVLFCDLDSFKCVNDTGGHAAGDAVLVECARRLVSAARQSDIVARVGGDEFVVVVRPWNRVAPGAGGRAGTLPIREVAVGIAERAEELLRQPIVVGDARYTVTASFGVAYANGCNRRDERSPSADDLLHRADTAMYEAKNRGKDGHFVIAD